MKNKEIILSIIIFISALISVKAFCQIPSSSVSDDCKIAYVNAINPNTGSTDTSTYTSAQINKAISTAQYDETIKRQAIAQDDVTLGLYIPLQQAIQSCINATTNSTVNGT